MISKEQQIWLNHLSSTDQVVIVPWDHTVEAKYKIVKEEINNFLGEVCQVEHRGATSFKISGQDEIDIYIPVKVDQFEEMVQKISELYGKPKSSYYLKRVRFVTTVQSKHIDVFVINSEDKGWVDAEIFHNYLLNHPDVLQEYRILKENFAGRSMKTYYTAKIEFINKILLIANQ